MGARASVFGSPLFFFTSELDNIIRIIIVNHIVVLTDKQRENQINCKVFHAR